MDRLVAFDHVPITQPVPDVSWFRAGVVVLVLVVTANRVLANPTNLVGAFWVGVTGYAHIPNSHSHAITSMSRSIWLAMVRSRWARS